MINSENKWCHQDVNEAFAYLYATFTSNSVEGEQLYYAVSTDGLHFHVLNKGDAVFASSIGNQSIRDPYLLRGEKGEFFLVSSDVRSSKDWNGGGTMVTYRSADLIHWAQGTLYNVNDYPSTQNTHKAWAPEAIYDPKAGQYLLYWANEAEGQTQSIWGAYTNFEKLISNPVCLYTSPDGHTLIDPHIYFHDGMYYLYFCDKVLGNGSVSVVQSSCITGPYSGEKQQLNTEKMPSEGPNLYKLIGRDTWIMLSDGYLNDLVLLRSTTDMFHFTTLQKGKEYDYDFHGRSGSVIQITKKEYEALLKAFSV